MTPEDELWQDSSDILDRLEVLHPEPPLYPTTPVQRVVSYLVELYGDEIGSLPAMHYRWSFDESVEKVAVDFSTPTGDPEGGHNFAKKMRGALPFLGVTPETTVYAMPVWKLYLSRFWMLQGAFIGMAFAFASFSLVADPSLLLPFVALFLVRIVNRSTGLKAKVGDSVLVLLLSLWAIYHLHSPLLGLVAALAFVSDALLRDGLPRQWVFAGLSAAAAGFALTLDPLASVRLSDLSPTLLTVVGVLSLLWLLNIAFTRSVASVGDIGEEPLSVGRVRMGMLVGWLVALQALTATDSGTYSSALVCATLAGLIVGRIATPLDKIATPLGKTDMVRPIGH